MNNSIMPNDRIFILVVTILGVFSVFHHITEASNVNDNKTGNSELLSYCTGDTECGGEQICKNNTCIDGCESLQCGNKGHCMTIRHIPRCYCGKYYISTGSCDNYCRRNQDCDISQTCDNHKCVDGWRWDIFDVKSQF